MKLEKKPMFLKKRRAKSMTIQLYLEILFEQYEFILTT